MAWFEEPSYWTSLFLDVSFYVGNYVDSVESQRQRISGLYKKQLIFFLSAGVIGD